MRNSSQRGSMLIYAMLTMSVMLAISLTLTSLFIAKLRSAAAARNAVVALYAADSAVELCLYEARTGAVDQPPRLTLPPGVTFEIKDAVPPNPPITGDCSVLGGAFTGFRATGKFQGTARTLEISQ